MQDNPWVSVLPPEQFGAFACFMGGIADEVILKKLRVHGGTHYPNACICCFFFFFFVSMCV